MLSSFELIATRFKYEKINMEKLGKKEPCLFLMNHSSFTDLKIASKILFSRPYNIISTVDAFIGVGYLRSWYNGYQPDGTIVMSPQGHEDYEKPDPFNGSSEVMPFKAGISIGYRLFNPKK